MDAPNLKKNSAASIPRYIRYVMLWCPFYTPISAVRSWGWWLHATSASGRRAPATEHIWMPKFTLVPSTYLSDYFANPIRLDSRHLNRRYDGVVICNCLYLAVSPDSAQSGFELVCCHELLHNLNRTRTIVLFNAPPPHTHTCSRDDDDADNNNNNYYYYYYYI
jgi:hypothetical protein